MPCFSQQNVSPETPKTAAGQQSASNTTPVFRVKSRLVIVNVVARNSKGVPVTDLNQDDFKILEDGVEQKVRLFSFQHPDAAADAQPAPAPPQPNVVDNLPHVRSGKALTVVLLDALNTSRANQAFMRDEMVKFLDKLPENEPIAVYLLGDKLRLLQDFTTDPTVLKQVVRSFKGKSSPYLSVHADGSPVSPILPGVAQSLPPQMAAQISTFQDQINMDVADLRILATLSAINSLGRTLAGYPGRKNLIWVSEAFPFDVLLSNATAKTSLHNGSYSQDIAYTGNLLSDAQIAIYPLDARGLAGSNFYNPTVASEQFGAASMSGGRGNLSMTQQEGDERLATHTTMNDLADRTGGRAFYGTNDLAASLRESIDDGSTYYTLGYYPDNKDWNGAFRKIQVKLQRSGVKLRYRIGYFASDSATFAKLSPQKRDHDFDEAMGLNVPVATALPFKAMVLPPSQKTGNKVVVNYGVDPHALSFADGENGTKQVDMVCAVRVFAQKNPDKPLATEAQKMGGAMNPEAYATIMKGYFPCREQFDLPPGDYILRLGVRDNDTGLIGTANASLTISAETSSVAPPAGAAKP